MNTEEGSNHMNDLFVYNETLGIFIPSLLKEWNEYDQPIQQKILLLMDHIEGLSPIE